MRVEDDRLPLKLGISYISHEHVSLGSVGTPGYCNSVIVVIYVISVK